MQDIVVRNSMTYLEYHIIRGKIIFYMRNSILAYPDLFVVILIAKSVVISGKKKINKIKIKIIFQSQFS